MKKYPYFIYVCCILAAASLLGSVSLFLTGLLKLGFTRYQVIFLRSQLSCILLGSFMAVRNRKALAFAPKDVWCFIGTGILNQLAFCICYYTSISIVGVAVASVLMFTSPIFAIILSVILFGEHLGKREVLALILALSGCVMVSGVGGEKSLPILGIALGLCSGLTYALGGVFNKFALQRNYSSQTITLYTVLFCTIGVTPIAFSSPFPLLSGAEAFKTAALMLSMSLLCSIIPTLLMVFGQKVVAPGRAAMLTSSELIVATLIGVMVFGEKLTPAALTGIVLIVVAVIILSCEKVTKKGG